MTQTQRRSHFASVLNENSALPGCLSHRGPPEFVRQPKCSGVAFSLVAFDSTNGYVHTGKSAA